MKNTEELVPSHNEKPNSPPLGSSLSPLPGEENAVVSEVCNGRDRADEGAQAECNRVVTDRHARGALLGAVVSPVPKDILRRFIVGSGTKVRESRIEAITEANSFHSTLGETNGKGQADDYYNENEANCTVRAPAGGSSLAIQQEILRKGHSYDIRIPYSDRIITLQKGTANARGGRSLPRQSRTSSSRNASPGEAASRGCFSLTSAKVCRCKHRDVLPESHIRGQLLREVASRIQSVINLSEPSLVFPNQASGNVDEERKLAVFNRPDVRELSTLYARLLPFDQHLLLSWSQWWRFQKCEGEDEHASQQVAVKPFFTLLHIIPKLRKASCLRPSITPYRVKPYMKINVDLMHVCLTAHYLFGQEDILAQEVLRMYEAYCFLNNTRSGEQLTPRLRSAIQYTEEIRQKLGFPCLSPLIAVARGETVTPSMNEELRQAEISLNETRLKHPQRWKDWIQHLQYRRQLRLQRDGEALLFKKCEQELERKWLQIVRLRQLTGFSQSNLEMKVAYIHQEAENDVATLQMEILAEAEELFYYYLEQTAKRTSLEAPGSSPLGGVPEACHSPGPSSTFWHFDSAEFVEAISFKFQMQGKRQPGKPLRRLLLTQTPHSVDPHEVIPPAEQARRLLASSLLSSISCKINGRALSRRAHVPLNVPSFASSSRHLLPPWDLNSSRAAVAALAGSVPGEPQETAAHTFGTLLAEPLTDMSFDVELRHAGLDIPRAVTTRVPIAPELSVLTRCPPSSREEQKTKDVLLSAENGGEPPLLSHPVTIYVDVPFSYTCAKSHQRDLHDPSIVEEKMASRHNATAKHGAESHGEEKSQKTDVRQNSVPLDAPSQAGIDHGVGAPKSHFFQNDRATRVTQNRMSYLRSHGQHGQRNFFLMEQTELRLNAAEWDRENAAAAEAEALNMAAALAAEAEAEAFMKAAMITAAAEATNDVENAQRQQTRGHNRQANRGWHDWKAFQLLAQNQNQQGSTSVADDSLERVRVSDGGLVAASGAGNTSHTGGSRHFKAHSTAKRRSVVEEEHIEVEQEARLLAKATILASCKRPSEASQMLNQPHTQPEKVHRSPSNSSIDGNCEAAIAGRKKKGRKGAASSSRKKAKKCPKAEAAELPVASNEDRLFDGSVAPKFATDGKHSSAPNEREGSPFSLRDGEYEIQPPQGKGQYPGLSTATVNDAPQILQRSFAANVGSSAEPPHIRTLTSTGSILPPPPVRVRKARRASDFSNNASTPFCRQPGEESLGPSDARFPQLPASAWMGSMTDELLVLQRTRRIVRDQSDLVRLPDADCLSQSPGRGISEKYCTEDGGIQTVMAGLRLRKFDAGPRTQDVAAVRVAHEQTSHQVLFPWRNSSLEIGDSSLQKFTGPSYSTSRNNEGSYECRRVGQAQRNVFKEAPEMLNQSECRSHLSGVLNEGSEDFSVLLNDADRFLDGEIVDPSESFEGCLKLKITLAPAPRESSVEALLKGLEISIVQRHQLESKVDADPCLTTVIRRLPTSPPEFRDHRLYQENDSALFSAAVAAAIPPPLDVAYSRGLQRPHSPTVLASGIINPRELAQQLPETSLSRSRPLSACIRFTLLLTAPRGSSGTCKAAWTLTHWSPEAFVGGTFAKKLMEQWRGAIPSLDSESWLLLLRAQETAVQRYKDSCQLETLTNDADTDDEDNLSEKPEEDGYVRTLRSALLASLPKQAAVALSSPESPPFRAVVREVIPGVDFKLLFKHFSLSCCFNPVLGFSRYLESLTARRRTTLIETEEKSLGIFLKVRRVYNVPVRDEPLSLQHWHYRNRVMERGFVRTPRQSGGVELCPQGFDPHGIHAESGYGCEDSVRYLGPMGQPEECGFATSATQLSNVVVELKYLNRSTGAEVTAATKAVTGENPVINQLIHLQLPSETEGDSPDFDDLVRQDSCLLMSIFDQQQRTSSANGPSRRFLGKVTIPWSVVLDRGDCPAVDADAWDEGLKVPAKNVALRVTQHKKVHGKDVFHVVSRTGGSQSNTTVCIMRACMRVEQPPVVAGYQRPTASYNGSTAKLNYGPDDMLRSDSASPEDAADDSSHFSLQGANSVGFTNSAPVDDFSNAREDPETLCMYIRFSLHIQGVPLRAVREAAARESSGRSANFWDEMKSSAGNAAKSILPMPDSTREDSATSTALETSSANGVYMTDNQGSDQEGDALRTMEERWAEECKRNGLWSPCSAFGLDVSGGLLLLCRLVAPLLPPLEVATAGSFRCFERAAAFVSLFPIVDDRLLFGLAGRGKVWLNPQEQVDIGCGEGRDQALLLCCFFVAFDLLLQTQCINYVARARHSGKGLRYLVLRQAVDGSVQLWDPEEPRCIFLPSPAFRYWRSRSQESFSLPCDGNLHQGYAPPNQALTILQQQRLLQAQLIEQQRIASSRASGIPFAGGEPVTKLEKVANEELAPAASEGVGQFQNIYGACRGVEGSEEMLEQFPIYEMPKGIPPNVESLRAGPAEASFAEQCVGPDVTPAIVDANTHFPSCISATAAGTVNAPHLMTGPFKCGGTNHSDEEGVMPVESLDIVFNNENIFANLQGLTSLSSCSDEVLLRRGGGDNWEPLTGGSSTPESERNLREKIRKKLLRHRRRRCCGLIYAFSQVRKQLKWLFTWHSCLRAIASFLSYALCDRRLRPPRKLPTLFELSFDFSDKRRWCALLPSVQELPFLNDLEAVSIADTRFQEALHESGDVCAAAKAAAASVGVGTEGLMRMTLFPPLGVVTPITAGLQYRPADECQGKNLEMQLQNYLETKIRRAIRVAQGAMPTWSQEQMLRVNGQHCRPSNNQAPHSSVTSNREAPSMSYSNRSAVFFARHIAEEIYGLLEHFETARSYMCWQQPLRLHERRTMRGGAGPASLFSNTFCYTTMEIETLLRECLSRHQLIGKHGGSIYSLPLHFCRMDKSHLWQLVKNTGVLEPCSLRSTAHYSAPTLEESARHTPRGAEIRERYTGEAAKGAFVMPSIPTFSLVVRIFPYPCGVYSGWVFVSRIS